jgi:hypothetical protein
VHNGCCGSEATWCGRNDTWCGEYWILNVWGLKRLRRPEMAFTFMATATTATIMTLVPDPQLL